MKGCWAHKKQPEYNTKGTALNSHPPYPRGKMRNPGATLSRKQSRQLAVNLNPNAMEPACQPTEDK